MTSRKEEGDYVDMSGLVLINCCYIPNSNEDTLQLVDDDFICICHIWIS